MTFKFPFYYSVIFTGKYYRQMLSSIVTKAMIFLNYHISECFFQHLSSVKSMLMLFLLSFGVLSTWEDQLVTCSLQLVLPFFQSPVTLILLTSDSS